MIDYLQARSIALESIGDESSLIDDLEFEKPYGWYFMAQSKALLALGEMSDMLFGSAGFIVERESGRIFQFGSGLPLDRWIANYYKGSKYNSYDLKIISVQNVNKCADILFKLDMKYVIPEFEHEIEWKIPRAYTRKQLRKQLQNLPISFNNQVFWHRTEIFDEIDASGCCEYQLSEHSIRQNNP